MIQRWSRTGRDLDESEVIKLIHRGASVTRLTQELGCGYPRALKFWQDLHRRGLCGPPVIHVPTGGSPHVDDGDGLEDICGGDLAALTRAIAHIDNRDIPPHYDREIRQRSALLRCAKYRRARLGLPDEIPARDLDILLPEGQPR